MPVPHPRACLQRLDANSREPRRRVLAGGRSQRWRANSADPDVSGFPAKSMSLALQAKVHPAIARTHRENPPRPPSDPVRTTDGLVVVLRGRTRPQPASPARPNRRCSPSGQLLAAKRDRDAPGGLGRTAQTHWVEVPTCRRTLRTRAPPCARASGSFPSARCAHHANVEADT